MSGLRGFNFWNYLRKTRLRPIYTQSLTEFFTEIRREFPFSVPLCAFSVMLCVQINADLSNLENLCDFASWREIISFFQGARL